MNTQSLRLAPLALASTLLLACGSDGPSGPPSLTASGEEPAGSAVYLRGRAEGDKLLVDVFARETPDVHGVALRLTYAPTVLTLVDVTPGEVWSSESLALAREGVPGETAVAWAIKGPTKGFSAEDETLLGTLRFSVKGRAESPLDIRAERSRVIDSSGKEVALSFRGGRVPAR